MAKTIDNKTRQYFPMFGKTTTWSDVWGYIVDNMCYDIEMYDHVLKNNNFMTVSIMHGTNRDKEGVLTDGVKIYEFTYDNDTYDKVSKGCCEYEYEIIFKDTITYLIKNKWIKKPRNSKKIRENNESKLNELKKERNRITMKICAWKKQNKDITELLKQKEFVVNQIKTLK